jgi:hypothetical protein
MLLLVVTAAVAIGVVRRHRDKLAPPGQSLSVGEDGVISVPILAAIISGGGGFGGMARNSINPTLALAPDGIAFKVLRQDRWAYGQLTRVQAAKGLLGPTLGFNTARANLHVTVRDLATARQVLKALPPSVPLSKKAAAVRDGTV